MYKTEIKNVHIIFISNYNLFNFYNEPIIT